MTRNTRDKFPSRDSIEGGVFLHFLATTLASVLQDIELAERTGGVHVQPLVYAGTVEVMAAR